MTLKERTDLADKVRASISAIAPHVNMPTAEWNDAVDAFYEAASQIYADGIALELALTADN